jgi:hypothetical protein
MMPERQLKILRKRLFVVTIIFSVAVIASFVLAVYSFYSAHSAASHDRLTICRAQNNSDKALREVLQLAEKLVRKTHNLPPHERLRSVEFYEKALSFVKTIDCRAVSSK